MKAEKITQTKPDDFLSLCAVDMTAKAYDKVIGRDKEVDNVVEILCRKNKANPILVGDAGVGKTSVVFKLLMKTLIPENPNLSMWFVAPHKKQSLTLKDNVLRGEDINKFNSVCLFIFSSLTIFSRS